MRVRTLSCICALILTACGSNSMLSSPMVPAKATNPVATATSVPTIPATAPATVHPATPTARAATPTPVIVADPFPVAMTFVNAQTGWLLTILAPTDLGGDRGSPAMLRRTRDGGNTWQSIAMLDTRQTSKLYFVNENNGWAFDPGLYSTHNGGKTWTDEHRIVTSLAVFGQTVWAATQINDTTMLAISTNGGQTWQPIRNQPSAFTPPISRYYLQVVFTGAREAYVFVTATPEDSNPSLTVTHDAGATWQTLPPPPKSYHSSSWGDVGWQGQGMIAGPDGKLWLHSVISNGGYRYPDGAMYTSADGGMTWTLVAINATQSAQLGNLPGQINGQVTTSGDTAFLDVEPLSVYRTEDGGTKWTEVVPLSPGIRQLNVMASFLSFADPMHGWYVSFLDTRVILRSTADGGTTWRTPPFPLQQGDGGVGYTQ